MISLPPLYPILDTVALARRGVRVGDAAAALLDAGAGILQFRHKGPFTRAVFEDAARIAELCRAAGALYIVNDRSDIAAIVGAGVHVGHDDLPPAAVRRVTDSIVGFSTHNEAQLRAAAAEPVDYVALGPIFSTGNKANPDPVVGLGELRRLRPLERRPLVAIGGITAANASQVRMTGADSVAVIGALYPESCTATEIGRAAVLLLARVSGR